MAKLILLAGGQSTPHDITEAETVIGRHPECTIVIDSNMVSRKHAKVVRAGDEYFIEDLGSGNGTTVNAQRIAGRTRLAHDDRVKLGPVLFRFDCPSPQDSNKLGKTAMMGGGAAVPKPVAPPIAADFTVDIEADEENATATVLGAVRSGGPGVPGLGGFGSLEVQPEAKLRGVLEISRALAGTVDLAAILPRILDSLFNIFTGADRGAILLKDPATGQLIPRAMKHRRPGEDESVKISRTIMNKVLTERSGILSADAANDARFEASESISNFTIRSMMCVPMLGLDGEPLGIINIDTQNPMRQFRSEDLDVLMAVAGQAALSYENARLAVSYIEKLKQDSEMNIAANVQRALLPSDLPSVSGYEFYAAYDTAQAVGGDYYDSRLFDDGRICLAFGDVAGKGVPASLVMSRLSAIVQIVLDFVTDAGQATEKINHHMCTNAVEGRFVTFVFTMIDTKTHEMQVCIAGHMSPMIRKADGTIVELPEDSIGLPLGVVDGVPFDVTRLTLGAGEQVVIYTDGVSEAMNHASDLYGMDRLREIVAKGAPNAAELGKIIREDVRRHANGRPQNDDITLMTFGRLA
jgi:sigma-B regulation protein RsbU (phosphoserine phosphatase)